MPISLTPNRLSTWRTRAAVFIAATFLVNAITPAHASGIPTVDAASIAARAAEHAASLAKYIEQIATLKAQLDTARRQYEAMSGTRNLGDIWNDPEIRKALPDDVQAVLKSAEESYGSISRSVKRIKGEETLTGNHKLDIENLEKRSWDFVTAAKAALEEARNSNRNRYKQLDHLQGQINMATDPKAISDLQARILVEQANVQADQMRADLLSRQLEAEKALIEKQAEKIAAQSFSVDAIRAPLPGAR